jgi:DNA-directed RNA polymerase subunit M/transcription elongation factor TFIIS
MPEKTFKKVCQCTSCGNESEMMVTCSLEEVEAAPPKPSDVKPSAPEHAHKKVKGHAVCSHCGNEADMWIDL